MGGAQRRAESAPDGRRSGSARVCRWHCPDRSSATMPPPIRLRSAQALPHDIPARTTHIEDLGDESPEMDLRSPCPLAAVGAAVARGQQVAGKQAATEFVKLNPAIRVACLCQSPCADPGQKAAGSEQAKHVRWWRTIRRDMKTRPTTYPTLGNYILRALRTSSAPARS